MDVVKFKKIIKQLKEDQSRADAWIYRIPIEIRDAFFDNPYVNSLYSSNTFLLSMVFEDEPSLKDELDWFLYDWSATKSISLRTIKANDEVYVINNDDDFCNYLIAQGYLH